MICVPLRDGEISSTLSKCTCLNTKRHITKDHSQHLRAFRMTSNSQNPPTAIISQPPTVMGPGERRGHHKITVASLCCDADEADSAFTAWTKDHQSCGLKASSTSHANPTRASYYQFERPVLAVTLPLPLPLPLPAHSRYANGFGLATQPSPSSYFDTTEILGAACDVIDSTSGSVLQSNKSVDHDADLRVQATTQTAYTGSPQHVVRPARPSYTDEQRFFIMYYRIARECSWSEIEVEFASFFDLRTKDAITSVYYRTRKMWGMDKVLETDLHSIDDRNRIESEASRFSRDFLVYLGYFD
jgi:hypothetical protein